MWHNITAQNPPDEDANVVLRGECDAEQSVAQGKGDGVRYHGPLPPDGAQQVAENKKNSKFKHFFCSEICENIR